MVRAENKKRSWLLSCCSLWCVAMHATRDYNSFAINPPNWFFFQFKKYPPDCPKYMSVCKRHIKSRVNKASNDMAVFITLFGLPCGAHPCKLLVYSLTTRKTLNYPAKPDFWNLAPAMPAHAPPRTAVVHTNTNPESTAAGSGSPAHRPPGPHPVIAKRPPQGPPAHFTTTTITIPVTQDPCGSATETNGKTHPGRGWAPANLHIQYRRNSLLS